MWHIKNGRPTFLELGGLFALAFLLTACGEVRSSDYEIRQGDKLEDIAYNYNVEPTALAKYNNLASNPTLTPGQSLQIPPPSVCTPLQGLCHEVAAGDTLASIAERYKSSKVTQQDIIKANKLTNPNYLRVGQWLIIPLPGAVVPTVTPAPSPTVCSYTFQPGDTLAKVAALHRVRAEQILSENGLASEKALNPGQKLIIRLPWNTNGLPGQCPAGSIIQHAGDVVPPFGPNLAGSNPPTVTPAIPGNFQSYSVQPGDTLTTIAQRFGTTLQILREDNKISNPNYIRSGQVLLIRKKN